MSFLKPLLLCILLITSGKCEGIIPPKVQILGGDDPVEFGEMVQLKALVDTSNLPNGLSDIKYKWVLFEDGKLKNNFVVWPDGTQIFFSTGISTRPRKITILLDVDCEFKTKINVKVVDPGGKPIDGLKIITEDGRPVTDVILDSQIVSPDLLIKEIQIGSTPGPDPNPNPNPQPLPPGKYGLAKTTYDLVLSNVNNEFRDKASNLADSYNKVADSVSTSVTKLAAGVQLTSTDFPITNNLQSDTTAIIKALKSSNGTVLGESASGWQQWDKEYSNAVFDLYKTRKINSTADWVDALKETAQGLKAVNR